jgi:UDP-glucose 4-epimerase
MGHRVLVTGLGTFWGGRVAQALEDDPGIDVIIGLDTEPPQLELERTEFVRVDENYSILSRIVDAAAIDTVIHTHLVVDSTKMPTRRMHEINVIGTMNLFAAASAAGSSVRRVVVKSSTMVYGSTDRDPVWFSEDTRRSSSARTPVERSLLEVEDYVADFAKDNPHVTVALLRFSNVLGPTISTPLSEALSLPVVPSILGFDPRFQFVHEDDVIRGIEFVLENELSGIFNLAGDGLLPWSEVAALCSKRTLPLSPWMTRSAALPLRLLGWDCPPEVVELLKFGRGVDNRRLKTRGFSYEHSSAGAVRAFAEALRLRQTVGDHQPTYRYEADVEQFFRHSPAVVREEAEPAEPVS